MKLLMKQSLHLEHIGVRSPYKDLLGTLLLEDTAIVTSGKSERFFTGDDGKIYHHIIDPATGKPSEKNLKSVTIISKNGTLSDTLSTTLFVMGKDKAVDYWRFL